MADLKRDKRLRPMYVVEILRKYSRQDRLLEQQEILDYLKNEYDVECSRRSLHSYIKLLRDNGYPIVSQKVGCYIAEEQRQVFSDAELRMMIDGVLFSRNISTAQSGKLIEKLVNAGTHSFRQNRDRFGLRNKEMDHSQNEKVLENVDAIHRAIAKKKKVRFRYLTYDTDFKLRLKRDQPDVFNPYRMIVNQGRYYVLGNYEKHDNIVPCRIDRMIDVEMLEENAKPERGFRDYFTTSLREYSSQHIYMFSGRTIRVKIHTEAAMMDTLVDWFGVGGAGKDFQILRRDGEAIEATLRCNEMAMKYWALQYGERVEVIEPKALREEIAKCVRDMYEIYCDGQKKS